ncbi:HBR353Cp [Eremothecium sinecaudum]|uniref:HBR353Cp n=1 Tax=Eremothecium sinecaudum TaxID=45286 RepID=A0A109UXD6_9SACH|nr:HBR353Cp [Eremothecium sinecaudum]AMD19254.1 HBR353Cp [Eremothecium sinecaudum]
MHMKLFWGLLYLVASALAQDRQFPVLRVHKNELQLYFVEAFLGTPGQQQSLCVDISHPYTWVISGKIYEICNRPNGGCLTGNLYYPGASSTNEELDSGREYNLRYRDGVNITGTVERDVANITLNNGVLLLTKMLFFSSELSNLLQGSLGLGDQYIVGDESDVVNSNNGGFSFLQRLKDSNLIETSSYSLWLANDTTTIDDFGLKVQDTGRLLMGAVDPQYYKGPLYQYDTVPVEYSGNEVGHHREFALPLTKVSISTTDGASLNLTSPNFTEVTVLNTRFHESYIPIDLLLQIAMQTNAVYVNSWDRWFVDCDLTKYNATLSFEFGETKINVPLSHFIDTSRRGAAPTTSTSTPTNETCYLGLYPNIEKGFSMLGANFLRSTYLAVDMEGQSFAIAQAKLGSERDTSNIAAIKSGSIPFAKSASQVLASPVTLTISDISKSTVFPNTYSVLNDPGSDLLTTRSFYSTSRSYSQSSTSSSSSAEVVSSNGLGRRAQTLDATNFIASNSLQFMKYIVAVGLIFIIGVVV